MKSLPPLTTLPAFLAVAEAKSFSRAAQSLSVTHSAVSQRIKCLEQFLGVKLFVRGSHQVELTPTGHAYYTQVKPALHMISQATNTCLNSNSNVLVVNFMTSFAMRWFIPRMQEFQDKYPEIDLRLVSNASQENVLADDIDISIVYTQTIDETYYHAEKLFTDNLVLVAHPQLLGKKSQQPLINLLKQYSALYVTADLRHQDWPTWCQHVGVKQPINKKRIYFQSTPQALQAVANAMGLFVTHKALIVDDLQSGALVKANPFEWETDFAYYLVFRKQSVNSQKVNYFVNWLRQQAANTRDLLAAIKN